MVAVLRILLLGAGCLLSVMIAKFSISDQTFWLQQTAKMDSSYQHEKIASQDLDKILDSNPSHSPSAVAFAAGMREQSAKNLNQLQALCHSFDRSEERGLLIFLLLQFSLLGGYLTFWYFMRSPNARLLAMMIKYGHKRGTLLS
jgi:hypothetical protein